MKTLLRIVAVSTLLVVPSTAHAQVSIGVRIGEPPAPRAYRVPNRPGPDYVWVEGYQYPQGSRYKWHDGYWTRPPYEGAYWVSPYYYSGMYYSGQWEGGRGDFGHNHGWDRGKQRDDRRDRRDDRGGRNDRDGRDNRRR
jgi:hypothetical protein